jgi:hypothetical protein
LELGLQAMTATTPTAATVLAHPNIALINYGGKKPGTLILPAVGSLSITLDTLATQTQVELVHPLSKMRFFNLRWLCEVGALARKKRPDIGLMRSN